MIRAIGWSVALWLAATLAWSQSRPVLELEAVKGLVRGMGDDAGRIGYAVRVPRGAEFQNLLEDLQHTYSRPFNSFVSWTVQVERTRAGSLEEAVHETVIPGTLYRPEGHAIAGGFQVVMRPADPLVAIAEVYTYKGGRNGQVRAHCSGPIRHQATVVAMCSSLTVAE